jgi:hypothetical protein
MIRFENKVISKYAEDYNKKKQILKTKINRKETKSVLRILLPQARIRFCGLKPSLLQL